MIMRELTSVERAYFHESYLTDDFHGGELKPIEFIEDLIKKGMYLCYGFFEEDETLGYAYFVKTNKGKALLLEYFAVAKSLRSKGYGSSFLAEIKSNLYGKYNVIIIEVENPDYAYDETNRTMRRRRIDFYLRNGFCKRNILSRIVAEEYLIMTMDLGKQLHSRMLYGSLLYLYRYMYGWKFMLKHISIRTNKAELT